jgi:hypothetical protein
MDSLPLPAFPVAISTFDHARDVVPKPRVVPLPALVRALTTFRVRDVADKRDLPAWSPARFAVGATRRSDAVLDVSCLVLDLDDARIDVVASAWADVLHVLHTTWSHTPERPRWRLVVPLARPVPASRWAEAWRWATSRTTEADPACKDPGRLYFAPAVAQRDQAHEARVHVAAVLDLLTELHEPPPVARRAARRAVRVPSRLVDRVTRRRLDEDPGTRERVAGALGATLTGEGAQRRAEDAVCPACGRASAWFWIEPRRQRRARCQHRCSCGWSGPLTALLGVRA